MADGAQAAAVGPALRVYLRKSRAAEAASHGEADTADVDGPAAAGGGSGRAASGASPVDPRLLAAVRVATLPDDWGPSLEAMSAEQLGRWPQPLASRQHDVSVLRLLAALVTAVYASLPTTIQQVRAGLGWCVWGGGPGMGPGPASSVFAWTALCCIAAVTPHGIMGQPAGRGAAGRGRRCVCSSMGVPEAEVFAHSLRLTARAGCPGVALPQRVPRNTQAKLFHTADAKLPRFVHSTHHTTGRYAGMVWGPQPTCRIGSCLRRPR